MLTLQDIINEIAAVRDTLNEIEVKGRNNQAHLVYAWDKCNDLIGALNDAAKQIQNESQPEITVNEVGEENGEVYTEPA